MAPLVLTLATVLLLVAFVVLTRYESRRGVRVLASWRAQFDQDVAHAAFVWKHVDLGAFVQDEVQHLLNRAGHASAHLTLQAVRAAERLLTRVVRHFRSKVEQPVTMPPRESAREFVQKLSDFKGDLQATRPDISDIP